ncbi:MAG: hypothetical protein HYU75_20455 [Betaproteobacteria bacterium]|nr:hypothetical protein [Betaproteobacteria bacterium]
MPRPFRQIVLLALLLILPLHGMAAVVNSLQCGPSDHSQQTTFVEIGANHDASTPREHAGHEGGGDTNSTHLSCQHLLSAIPFTSMVFGASAIQAFEPLIPLPSALFFPEQPRRPPRL